MKKFIYLCTCQTRTDLFKAIIIAEDVKECDSLFFSHFKKVATDSKIIGTASTGSNSEILMSEVEE